MKWVIHSGWQHRVVRPGQFFSVRRPKNPPIAPQPADEPEPPPPPSDEPAKEEVPA